MINRKAFDSSSESLSSSLRYSLIFLRLITNNAETWEILLKYLPNVSVKVEAHQAIKPYYT
jgi:hypothetical protein